MRTAWATWAGTDANVFVKIKGTRGETDPVQIDNENHDDFELGRLVHGRISAWFNNQRRPCIEALNSTVMYMLSEVRSDQRFYATQRSYLLLIAANVLFTYRIFTIQRWRRLF